MMAIMKISESKGLEADAVLALFLFDKQDVSDHPFVRGLSKEDREFLSNFKKRTEFKGVFSHLVFLPSGRRVFLLGQGDGKKFDFRKSLLAMRRAVAEARRAKIKSLEVCAEDFATGRESDPKMLAEAIATQAELANFEFLKYKTEGKEAKGSVEVIHVYSSRKSIEKALARGKAIGEEINEARVLANTSGGDMTPATLAAHAVALGKTRGIRVKVLDEKEMKRIGMGAILGVAQGSSTPPRFIVMEYLKGKKKDQPVVLVGKGITFDTGGLNLKPSQSIYEMHMDMTGGAVVIHTIAALARLGAKCNVVGLIPAAENMVSGSSYRPGDVLKSLSGKTIEILNTDAEGRVVLADGLTYAQKQYSPRLVVDVATLSGAAMVALGQRASALFATDERLARTFREFGEKTGDYVWPLPLWEEYEEEVRGTFGDVANVGKYDRMGGAIMGAVFLWQFIKGTPWVHLDIAPRMTSIEGDYLAKGATGSPVNLLVHLLETF